jgi:hypothetical protein
MRFALCSLALAAGCGASAPRAATTESLWALAPAGTTSGVVATGEAIDGALTTLRLVHASSPEIAAKLEAVGGTLPIAPWAADAIARSGVDVRRGFALFTTEAGAVALFGVSDEKAFRATLGAELGTCKAVRGYMACADDPTLIDRVGTGVKIGDAVRAFPAAQRGNAEVVVASRGHSAAASLRISRGVVEGRVRVSDELPVTATERSPLAAAIDDAGVTGAMLVDVRSLLAGDNPLAAALGDIGKAFRGDALLAAVGGDQPRGFARIPVTNPAVARELLAQCGQLASLSPSFTATPRDGGCDVSVSAPGGGPSATAHVTLAGDELRAEIGTGALSARGAPPARLRELFAEPWNIVAWSRFGLATFAEAAPLLSGTEAAVAQLVLHVDELGVAQRAVQGGTEIWFAIGTVWRNDDAVLAALEPVLARAGREPLDAPVRAVAARFPTSPLAEDVRLGFAGGVPVAAAVGVVAGFWIPRFMRSIANKRDPEAVAGGVVRRYAFEAYPQWAIRNPGSACPASLDDLDAFMPTLPSTDPWAQPYQLRCGDALPAGAKGIAVFSMGPDGVADTDDDIRSWQ